MIPVLTSKTPGSISLALDFKLSKQDLHHALINSFSLREKYKKALAQYYLETWDSHRLKQEVKFGYIGEYLVVFQHSPSELYRSSQVILSFRAVKEEFGIPKYVIVRKYTP